MFNGLEVRHGALPARSLYKMVTSLLGLGRRDVLAETKDYFSVGSDGRKGKG